MGDPSVVLYEVRGSAAWITLNRPERRNALDHEAIERLIECLALAAADGQVRSVVLTGAGNMFCAGGDFAGMSAGEGRVGEHERRGRLAEVFRAMAEHPKPIIARVNGVALGGGFGLVVGCDLAVATETAEFGTPEVNAGLWPFMITAVIQRGVPRKLALEMMMTGRRLISAEAERWGIVNQVVRADRLDDAVARLADDLAGKSPVALRLGKESFYRAQDMSLEQALAYLNAMLTVDLESEDVVEGVSAFLERRPPEWKGR